MSKGLPQIVKENIEKMQSAALAAVDGYNRPGRRFRTAQYIVLITLAWTAFFHAVFYRRGEKPWYTKPGHAGGTGVRYQKVEGEPKHWDLSQCLKRYFREQNPPERRNLEFLIGLRNKIEHRNLPALDPALYGECQSALLNLEESIDREFGSRYRLEESLAISLQFSRIMPTEKRRATKELARNASRSVVDYIETFRGNLPPTTLESTKYSFSVYLVPKVAGRQKAADAVVEFIPLDEASEEQRERMKNLNVLIREKHIPIANINMLKPSEVVARVCARIPYKFNMSTHTIAWKHYRVRPEAKSETPHKTTTRYCVYDEVHRDYVYTDAWVDRLAEDLADRATYHRIVGKPATRSA